MGDYVNEGKKVLFVEDDPDHADLITEVLGEEDIEKDIILMRDGQETIDYFQELSVKRYGQRENKIKLIILDLNFQRLMEWMFLSS